MNLRTFLVIILIIIGGVCFGQDLFLQKLKNLQSDSLMKGASIGVSVVDMENDSIQFCFNQKQSFVPASVLKLITSATAFEKLSAEYRFKTEIGYIGKIKDKKLVGNLVVIGGGDPALGSVYFQDEYFNPHFMEIWAKTVKSAGITIIDGDLILDGSIYDNEGFPRTWIWEDIGNYYGAGTNALTVYDNQFRITFKSPKVAGKAAEIISVYPKVEGLNIINEVISSDINRDMAYVFGSPLDKTRKITGTIPKNRKAFSIKAAIQNPQALMAKELINYLAQSGIFLLGNVKFERVKPRLVKKVYVQESPALTSIIKVLNHESVNLFAEHLVKQMAFEKMGLGSTSEGVKIVKEFWAKKGVNTHGMFIEDGSGLSHFNAISPQQIVDVLLYMKKRSGYSTEFVNSLPSAGKGTLSVFDGKKFSAECLKCKSGSMTRVRCYAGYLHTDLGNDLCFAIMVNNFSMTHSDLIQRIEELLLALKKEN